MAKKYQAGFDSKNQQQGVHASLGKTSHQRGHSICDKANKTRIASYGPVAVIFNTRAINKLKRTNSRKQQPTATVSSEETAKSNSDR